MQDALRTRLRSVDPVLRTGRVRRILSTHLEADGPNVPLGTLCDVDADSGVSLVRYPAEVVRINADSVILSPLEDGRTTQLGAVVRARREAHRMAAGARLLGRAVDALGRPADGKGEINSTELVALQAAAPSPLTRCSPQEVLETGLRAIDTLLTLGKGQRVGVFAAAGVGKTTLVADLAENVKADIVILCLVGERGREVESIWQGLNAETRARSTLVASTSDQPAAMRVRASHYALALGEYWRDRGKHVLLLLDSATRLAMAMREIGLAAGEPPTVRAYTPGVFAQLPKLVERCGALKSGGAISAIITVLSESDDIDDPVSELMKSLLDGHIVLSRALAEEGQFPAIDVCRSVSRQAETLMTPAHRSRSAQIVEWMTAHQSSRLLVDAGLYTKGANPKLDRAIEKHPDIVRFLKQPRRTRIDMTSALADLSRLSEGDAPHAR
jgi:flagellum-specific ATP synthase